MSDEKSKIEFVSEPCSIKPRKFPPQNIVIRLRRRELIGCQYPGTQVLTARQFYQNVFPNFTVVNVEKPPCFLRKFSPDGRFLVAFSADQTSIEVYKYEGASAAAELLVDCKGEYVGHRHDDKTFNIRSNIFQRFFKVILTFNNSFVYLKVFIYNISLSLQPKWVINVVDSNEQLNRECSLFTEDARYVIVGSARHIPDDLRPHFYQVIFIKLYFLIIQSNISI